MLRPKKNSYKEFDDEKKFPRLENSPPPPQLFYWFALSDLQIHILKNGLQTAL